MGPFAAVILKDITLLSVAPQNRYTIWRHNPHETKLLPLLGFFVRGTSFGVF